jgi:hypothetical protein
VCALLGDAAPAAAQAGRYALIVEGASGEPQFATLHRGWLDTLATRLRDDLQFDASHLIVLAEKPGAGERGATADEVRAAFAALASRMTADDQLFVMLIGHGSGQGPDAKFNLVGRDMTVTEWSDLVGAIPGRTALVNATSASFPYLAGLAGDRRVVITATSTYSQRVHTQFAGAFSDALGAAEADADKDGRISILEAFTHASRIVAQYYEQAGTMATEKAVLDDTGDGVGRPADDLGEDGVIAGLFHLGVAQTPSSSDPEVQALVRRQTELTEQVDELRRTRRMIGETAFAREFERLIVELALASREVRRRAGG